MDKRKKAILIALGLGDGYFTKPSHNNPTPQLYIEHSEVQKEYIEYKHKLLISLLGGYKPKIAKRTRVRNGKTLNSYRFVKTHKYFKVLRRWMYDGNIKRFRYNYLKLLTPEALAILIMDDGSQNLKRRDDGSVKSCQFKLSICSEYLSECNEIIKFFKDYYDIHFTSFIHMRRKKDNKPLYSIHCGTKEWKKLAKLVKPYIIPSMMYKISILESKSAKQ